MNFPSNLVLHDNSLRTAGLYVNRSNLFDQYISYYVLWSKILITILYIVNVKRCEHENLGGYCKIYKNTLNRHYIKNQLLKVSFLIVSFNYFIFIWNFYMIFQNVYSYLYSFITFLFMSPQPTNKTY